MINTEGKKVVDISQLLNVFEAQEGTIESWTGRIGSGKTYGATRRALNDLRQGKVVYTNWQMNLDHITADDRQSFGHALANFLFFRKRFYNINVKKNWYYYDLDRPDIVDFISGLTDCTVYADEGQDIFDSYEGTKMSKKKRKSLTRTRHLNKTLVIISQRPQAIAVTARANVAVFHKHVKVLSWPFLYFKVYSTEDIDAQNMPIFSQPGKNGKLKMTAPITDRYFGSKEVYMAYNSKYLRAGMPKSQDVNFEAYDFNFVQRFLLVCVLATRPLMALLRARSARKIFVESTNVSTKIDIQKVEQDPLPF